MNRNDLISYSNLAGECGVTSRAISKRVRRMRLAHHRLPHSPTGRALAPVEADAIRAYYREKRGRRLLSA